MLVYAWAIFVCSIASAQTVQNRLSDWLVSQPYLPNSYPLGLSLRIPEEVPVQRTLQLNLLKSLSSGDRDFSGDPQAVRRLANFLRTLPVTGRIPVTFADARWLQANPKRDPLLLPGYRLVLPVRPQTVTVVRNTGDLCQVIHSLNLEAKAYVAACEPPGTSSPDWAWIAQPDGQIQRFGIATWNQNKQDEPAPGAWIWAPSRDRGWSEQFSERLISFLATQGPAPDRGLGHASTTSVDQGDHSKGSASKPLSLQGMSSLTSAVLPVDTNSSQAAEKGGGESSRNVEFRSRDPKVSASDWGVSGLLQTPTARMQQVGTFTFSASRVYPYTRGNVIFQPFDWLEAGFRYTNISNRLYGPASLSGDQAYKDKSFDFKAKVLEESAYVPQVSIGVQDLTGTGLFSGEYIVGSKRTGSFDWSLGIGWGYLGARGDIRNPLSRFSTGFDTRTNTAGPTGGFSLGSYFHGPTAFFGGLQFQTPWEPLTLKVEYDGNNYQSEPQNNNLPQKNSWNLGAVYRLGDIVDLSVGFERGNTLMFGLTLHSPLDRLYMPKLNDPPRVPVAAARSQRAVDWAATARDVQAQSDWHVREIRQTGRGLHIVLDDAAAIYMRERVDRVASVLHRDAPPSVDRFNLIYRQSGIEVAEHNVDREAWVEEKTQSLPPRRQRNSITARSVEIESDSSIAYSDSLPRFESGLGTNFQQTLGGPDGFVLFQIGLTQRAKYRIRDDTWIQGYAQLGLVDNYSKFKYTAPSNLPRVRTYLREFLTSTPLTMPNLQLTHVGQWRQNQYYSLYGGYLESMFAGVGAEWLYRPFGSRTAFGIDVNAVQQRDFHQDFSFKNAADQTGYRVATGHATLYWDTGWNGVQANLSAGRYLAKDLGVTVQVSKVFQNSVTVGAFFSKTNVSTAQFGEGSFDKGIYVSIPFDAFLTKSSNSIGNFVWKPLTRDGGAKLARNFLLYDFTSIRDGRTLDFKLSPKPEEITIPEERAVYVPIARTVSEPYALVTPRAAAAQWVTDSVRYEQQVAEALHKQGFRNIQVSLDASQRLSVRVSNEQIRPISRAVGRAARTALQLSPIDVREIRIEYLDNNALLVTYDFVDLAKLSRYLAGGIKDSDVEPTIAVNYINPGARQANPLDQLVDLDTRVYERSLGDALLPAPQTSRRVVSDVLAAGRVVADSSWIKAGFLGTGVVLASSLLDNRADRFAKDHADNRWLKGVNTIGNALPWFAIAGSVAMTFDESDPVRARTAYAATEAGGAAFLAVTGLKYVVGRARPGNDVGSRAFTPFSSTSGYDSFPSGHTIISWAVATPFAQEYDAPWLYGVAAVTNLARLGSRQHWVSDTVAGSLLGYAIGNTFRAAGKESAKGSPRVVFGPQSIGLAWALK